MGNIKTDDALLPPQKWPEVTRYLTQRRSNLVKSMTGPGPSAEELEQILTIGARVPDHRALAPWRFLIFQGAARHEISGVLEAAYLAENPDASAAQLEFEGSRFMQAPLVICVISSPVEDPKQTPIWEQELSAGAACFNLCLAAQSFGYGAQWLTQWYAYSEILFPVWGLEAFERIAGFIFIGTCDTTPNERIRPDLNEKVTYWAL